MIFIDTGAWYALKVADDKDHERALGLYKELGENRFGSLVTSDYIVDEACTLLLSHKGIGIAATLLNEILASNSVRLERIDKELFLEASTTFRQSGTRGWSFTDCTSFELMHRLKIEDAFAFDRHFSEAGFNRYPFVTDL